MRGDRQALLDAVIDGQKRFLRATQAASTPTWLEIHLSMAQLKALFVLAHGATSVTGIGEALGTGKAAASLLVDRLVRVGLVDRTEDPTDRRRTLVHLTAEGERSVGRLREGGRERFREWLDRLSDDDLAALAQGIRALAAVAGSDTVASNELGDARLEGSGAATSPTRTRRVSNSCRSVAEPGWTKRGDPIV